MIFKGSMSIISKTQGKKLEQMINLAQCIEPGRMMRWSDVDISFGPHDHLDTEPSDRNLSFVVKLPIGATQGGQYIDRQRGLIKSYHEENYHRDGLQSERYDSLHDTFSKQWFGQ
jgi:hypothetical protein